MQDEVIIDIENPQESGDLINRKAVLQAVSEGCQELRGVYGRCEKLINALPPVTPKSGKWIMDGSVDCYLERVRCHCSECGKKEEFPADYDHITKELSISYRHPEFIDNYCPNCGCRMVEPQESEG